MPRSAQVEGALMPEKTLKQSGRRAQATAKVKQGNGSGRASAAPSARSKKKAARASSDAHGANGGSKGSAASKAAARKTAAAKAPARKPLARKSNRVQPIPEMYGPVTAQLVVSPCAEAMAFYQRAFGAREVLRMPGPDGLLVHAEIDVGGAIIMLSDQVKMPGPVRKTPKSAGATTGGVMLYVKDVDAAFVRAVEAGAQATMPPQDQFWGDRFAQVEDPYGHVWSIATHIRDVTPEEMQAALAQMHAAEA
jgi:uncharacterized glyoxalase superfamily protein PhnB